MKLHIILFALLTACSSPQIKPPTPTPMLNSKGISLHIGMNSVNPAEYGGWAGVLPDCELDANAMEEIAKANGFTTHKMLTQFASADVVMGFIAGASLSLKSGDTFLLTYSGHGGQVPDRSGDESDDRDETWLLWDRQVSDDEIALAVDGFATGVNVIVVSDSCHSGTVSRAPGSILTATFRRAPQQFCEINYELHKVQIEALKATRSFHGIPKQRLSGKRKTPSKPITLGTRTDPIKGPFRMVLGACQDNQLAMGTGTGGAFTLALLQHLGASSTYRELYNKVVRQLPPTQIPSIDATLAGPLNDRKPFSL